MKPRRLIHWKNIKECEQYFKGVGYSGESLACRVKNSIMYGNYFAEDRIGVIKGKYDVRVIGGGE